MTKQSANGRWKNGLGYKSSPHFWSAIQKYGWENFSHEILFAGLSVEDACKKEQLLIKELSSINREYGYNEKAGGQRGAFINEFVREKLSRQQKEFYAEHPEAKAALAERVRGFRHTEEAKRKMSEAAKHRHYKLSDAWKQNIGAANKARVLADNALYEETCKRCRENGAKAAKPVVQLSIDGMYIATFNNSHEAERNTGIRNGNIGRCCRGETKSAGGYKWQYANEYNGGRETA